MYTKKEITPDIFSLHPREKVQFICEACNKTVTVNSEALCKYINIGPDYKLLCPHCSESFTKRNYRQQILKEFDLVHSKKDLFYKNRNRELYFNYVCEDCKNTFTNKASFLMTKPYLICAKCYKKYKTQMRFGVDNVLTLHYQKGVKCSHTKEGIEKTRAGIIKHLWQDNFASRQKTMNKYGWQVVNINFETMELHAKRDCCGYEIKLKCGDLKPYKWKCTCSKSGYSSAKETQLLEVIRSLFPELEIISSYRGWCKDTSVVSARYEIDIFIPELMLGIEFNGIYWHDKQNQQREDLKKKRAMDVGIKIIDIWEDDWDENRSSCIQNIIEVINELH